MKTESMIAKKVREMKPSGIRVFFDLVLGMKDVISLGVGEPDHVTPWVIREAGITAIEQGYTSYTSNKGLMKLRLYIARHIQKETGVSYDPEEEILITVGVSEAVDLAMRALLDPGDRVLIPLPSYVSYGPTVELAGGIPVFIDTEKDGFRLTPKTLEKAIRPRTKALLLNYPNNPTGVTYTRKELNALKNVLLRHKILCISDEIYGDLTYDFKHTSFPSLPRAKPATLLLNGFSKGHAMTGWRIGYACGPAPLIAAMTKIHQYTILCPSIVSQMAACEALQSGKRAVAEMKRDYARRRRIVRDALERIGFEIAPPQGAFYAFAS
ncbi:MAG: aminotransferase class I/II-fold pyridoxal phosphate-dependent enzyme, partial [Candidatus Hydrogenedentota bacterium]